MGAQVLVADSHPRMNFVACGIVIFQQWRELVPMLAELLKQH
jgi:hypothetical protein